MINNLCFIFIFFYFYFLTCLFSFPGGTAKQGDSLEDFKKIAQKNGITVCPAGNEF